MTTSTITKPRATKKFKGLVAVLGSDEAAVTAWNKQFPESPIGDVQAQELPADVKTLVDAGFTVEEAQAALNLKSEPKKKGKKKDKAKAEAEVIVAAPLTSSEQAEALVAQQGLMHVRGRVYSTPAIIEAQVRVLKQGKPEIVRNPGAHRTKAVVIWRMDDGQSVAVQNLGEPS